MPERLGLRAVFERLLQSDDGRRAVRHLATAAEAPERSRRRTHLRTAVRLARRALL